MWGKNDNWLHLCIDETDEEEFRFSKNGRMLCSNVVCKNKFQQLESCKKTYTKILGRTKNVVVDTKFISMNYMYSTKHTLYVYSV